MEQDVSPVTALVVTAAAGDQQAWRELVDRYAPLLVSVIRGFRLTPAETEDVAQTVWLRLVEHLDSLQEPRAIPGWLVTTARRESIRYLSSQHHRRMTDPLNADQPPVAVEVPDPDEALVRSERHQVLLAGLAELPSRQRELLLLLMKLGSSERKKLVHTALELVGLADRARHLPRQMSGGQEQRVAIARAIVTDPKLIVADEPTGNLDSVSADAVLAILRTLSTEAGKTVIMVTHDPRAAEYGTRSIHLEKGRLRD